MRFPTTSQMIDKNTISYYPFDGNLNDACGNYNLSSDSSAIYTTVGNYPNGEEVKTVYSTHSKYYNRGLYNNSLLISYIFSNTCTIDFAFRILNYNNSSSNWLFQRDTGSDHTSFTITSNNNYLSAVNSWDVDGNKYAFRVPLSEVYQNGFHHLAWIRNGNNNIFYLNGKYVGSIYYNPNTTYGGAGLVLNRDGRCRCYDMLYFRVSNGIRWSKEFIGNTPIDNIYWTVKEKENDIYGLRTNSDGE